LPDAAIKKEPLRIEGLNCGDTSKSALLITHYHMDHIGKLTEVDPEVQVYMGHIAHDIFCKLQRRLSFAKGEIAEKADAFLERCADIETFLDEEPFSFGPFYIKPIKMDHSAYDTYGFLIENIDDEEDIVFHTGDFRAHGLFGEEFYDKITHIPPVKAIVCEGTNIENNIEEAEPEHSIGKRFKELFKENKYNVVFVSSTNIDRLFAIYHAAAAAGRPLLMDEYQFDILKSVIGENDWRNNDKTWIDIPDENGNEQSYPSEGYYEFSDGIPYILKLDRYRRSAPSFFIPEQLDRLINWKGCVLIARSTPQFTSLINTFPKDKTKKYLSMWKGYLDPAIQAYNKDLAKTVGPDYEYVHTSGHADSHTLEQLFTNVEADIIIPIHTANPKKFLEKMGNWPIKLIADGETIELETEEED
ncbi:MAG: hypothetical protein K2H76_05365, partial [Muribaculaceae bacterium]|nr:hypothetical protein [Muribaculaceae bacterium]